MIFFVSPSNAALVTQTAFSILQISREHIKAITAASVSVVQLSAMDLLEEEKDQEEGTAIPFLSSKENVTQPSTPSHAIVSKKKEALRKIHKLHTRSHLNELSKMHHTTKLSVITKDTEERSMILKVAKTIAIVYGCFMVCWLPVSIFATGLAWSHTTFATIHAWPHVLVVEILPMLNSTMNPIIYSLKSEIYLKALGKMTSKAWLRVRNAIGL